MPAMTPLDPEAGLKDTPVVNETDVTLTAEQVARVAGMVYRQGKMDHTGSYTSGDDGKVHQIAKIHMTYAARADLPDSETQLYGVDNLKFTAPVHIFLEDADGAITAWGNARGTSRPSWIGGVIFLDDDGDAWISGCDDVADFRHGVTAEMPILKQISRTGYMAGEKIDLFEIAESRAADGEFYVADGVVTDIPWWGGFGDDLRPDETNPSEDRLATIAADQATLAALIARVADLKSTATPGMA